MAKPSAEMTLSGLTPEYGPFLAWRRTQLFPGFG